MKFFSLTFVCQQWNSMIFFHSFLYFEQARIMRCFLNSFYSHKKIILHEKDERERVGGELKFIFVSTERISFWANSRKTENFRLWALCNLNATFWLFRERGKVGSWINKRKEFEIKFDLPGLPGLSSYNIVKAILVSIASKLTFL